MKETASRLNTSRDHAHDIWHGQARAGARLDPPRPCIVRSSLIGPRTASQAEAPLDWRSPAERMLVEAGCTPTVLHEGPV
jgi:hypothetical protein